MHATKKDFILASLDILKQDGVEGITLRRVANTTNKDLNLVQYHLKNKNNLLKEMANYYFDQCDFLIDSFEKKKDLSKFDKDTLRLVEAWLNAAETVNDACIVFRELWALSVRDSAIESQVTNYYELLHERVAGYWKELDHEKSKIAAAILIPFADGYSIQHKAIHVNKKVIAKNISSIIIAIFKNN